MSNGVHNCPVPGCKVADVPDHRLMCIAHWHRVPKFLQDLFYAAWNALQEADRAALSIKDRVTARNHYHRERAKAIGFAQRKEI